MHYEKIEMPDNSVELSKDDYENLSNEIKAKVLGFSSIVDTQLTEILTEIFVLDTDRKGLWFDTVFDEERNASFGARIHWLGKILANHDEISAVVSEQQRKDLDKKLRDISKLRNLFAHTMTFRDISDDIIKNRKIILIDLKEMGSATIEKDMNEIVGIVNDESIITETQKLIKLAIDIRRKRTDEMCLARQKEKEFLDEQKKQK